MIYIIITEWSNSMDVDVYPYFDSLDMAKAMLAAFFKDTSKSRNNTWTDDTQTAYISKTDNTSYKCYIKGITKF